MPTQSVSHEYCRKFLSHCTLIVLEIAHLLSMHQQIMHVKLTLVTSVHVLASSHFH